MTVACTAGTDATAGGDRDPDDDRATLTHGASGGGYDSALQESTTLQRLLCIAINDLFEAKGRERLADETARPRGGAAHKLG